MLVPAAAGVMMAAALVSGCATGAGGRLGELRRIAEACPEGKRVAALVSLDESKAQRGAQLAAARIAAVRAVATRVAACSGRLRVVVFSASSVASIVVSDGTLEPKGATENARLRRVDALVAKTLEMLGVEMPRALARLSSQGSDPIGQLETAQEYAAQLGEGFAVEVLIESSGVSRRLRPWELDRDLAIKLADAESVPDLSGVELVTFAGLGRVGSGAPPSTKVVTALRVFYERVCQRTSAGRCVATTAVAPIGG